MTCHSSFPFGQFVVDRAICGSLKGQLSQSSSKLLAKIVYGQLPRVKTWAEDEFVFPVGTRFGGEGEITFARLPPKKKGPHGALLIGT